MNLSKIKLLKQQPAVTMRGVCDGFEFVYFGRKKPRDFYVPIITNAYIMCSL